MSICVTTDETWMPFYRAEWSVGSDILTKLPATEDEGLGNVG